MTAIQPARLKQNNSPRTPQKTNEQSSCFENMTHGRNLWIGIGVLVSLVAFATHIYLGPWEKISPQISSKVAATRHTSEQKMSNLNEKFARNGADFTMELFRQIAAGNLKSNVIFSPLSVQACVALAFAGSLGETAEEIANGMKYVSSQQKEVASSFKSVLDNYENNALLKIANKAYVMQGFTTKSAYGAALKEFYHAAVENLNFADSKAAANAINAWVESKTAGKIKELISENYLNDLTRLVLLNAVHFKGDWEKKFDAEQTAKDDFWISETEKVQVEYMNQKAKFNYGFFEELDASALEMPYKDSDLSMFVLLPQKRAGLKDLADKLKTVNLLDLAGKLHNQEVLVKFPKFKVDFSIELNEPLMKLGVKKMFTPQAEFDVLESPEPLYVSKIMHKASIEVNEEGSEAAAATGMVMMMRCLIMPQEFNAQHPFLYMIRSKNTILFAGAFIKSVA